MGKARSGMYTVEGATFQEDDLNESSRSILKESSWTLPLEGLLFRNQDTRKNTCGHVSRAWMRFRESSVDTVAVFLRNGAGISTIRVFVLNSCLMHRGERPHNQECLKRHP